MQDLITIKGNRDGLRVLIDESAPWADVLHALQHQLDHTGSFFVGAQLIMDIGEREVSEQELADMLALMDAHGIRPESLAANARESRNAARSSGITARPVPQPPPTPADSLPATETESLFVHRTIRSGQIVRHHGHMTILGDVNPGAQIIAGGSIIVWGRLRGLVHAGALGDTQAVVGSLDLRPTQLRIANLIARTPEDANAQTAEIARIEQDYIIVESWLSYKKGP